MRLSALYVAVLACVGVVRAWNCGSGGRTGVTLQPRFDFCDKDVNINFGGSPSVCTGTATTGTATAPTVELIGRVSGAFYSVLLVEKGSTQATYRKLWLMTDVPDTQLDGMTTLAGTEPVGATANNDYGTTATGNTYQLLIFEQVGDTQAELIYFPISRDNFNVAIFIENNCNGVKVFNELTAIREFEV